VEQSQPKVNDPTDEKSFQSKKGQVQGVWRHTGQGTRKGVPPVDTGSETYRGQAANAPGTGKRGQDRNAGGGRHGGPPTPSGFSH